MAFWNKTMAENEKYETLDPENWDDMRILAHQMVDDSIDYLKSAGERPVWQRVPDSVARTFHAGIPEEPSAPSRVYREFQDHIFPYSLGCPHPRFWGWYMGNGTIMGALADFMAATMNSNLGGGHHSAIMVEQQVINWMKDVVGFPEGASGLLVSGGSMANIVGLTVARNSMVDWDIRKEGIPPDRKRLTIYASTEAHSCNQKGVEQLGLGSDNLRKIPVRDDYTMDLEQLQAAIEADRQNGCQGICVIASSGTVNTGAIDDLNGIADICEKHQLWFHIDGAIGGIAMLSDQVKPRLEGIERADSIALDLHKWLHIPFEAACVLVKEEAFHRESFSLIPAYLEQDGGGMASGGHWYSEYGLQLSRGFRALKVWMTMKEHGSRRLGRMISRNVEQAQYLGRLIESSSDLELVAPIGLDIVCYRFNPGGMDSQSLNRVNRRILAELQENGIAAPSFTTLHETYCIRVAIANHRSRYEDFDLLVNETIRIGKSV